MGILQVGVKLMVDCLMFVLDGLVGMCVDIGLVCLLGLFWIVVVVFVEEGVVELNGVLVGKFDWFVFGVLLQVWLFEVFVLLQNIFIDIEGMMILYFDDDIVVVDKLVVVVVYVLVGWIGLMVFGGFVVVGYWIIIFGVYEWQGIVYCFDVGIFGVMVVVIFEWVYIVLKWVFKYCMVDKWYYVLV